MSGILDRILDYLKVKEIRALNVDSEKREVTRHWPRLLSFSPAAQSCDDDDEEEDTKQTEAATAEIELVPCDESEEDVSPEEDDSPRNPSPLSRKLNCMYHSAKYGLKEGALSGIFFGGGWGIHKYVDAVYLKKEKGEGEDSGAENSEGNGSTVNDNIIFVTAANGAIAMGVFCTFFCCTKAAIYCN